MQYATISLRTNLVSAKTYALWELCIMTLCIMRKCTVQSYASSVHESNFHHHILPASSGHLHYSMIQLWENSRRHRYTFQFPNLVCWVLGSVDLRADCDPSIYLLPYFSCFSFIHKYSSRSRYHTILNHPLINNPKITIYHNRAW